MTCIVKNARSMLNGVQVRLYAGNVYAIGLVQYYKSCCWKYTETNYSGRFRADCDSGTKTYRAVERKYIFTILKPKPADKTFLCAMKLSKVQQERKVKSKTFSLQFYGKITAVTDINVTSEETPPPQKKKKKKKT